MVIQKFTFFRDTTSTGDSENTLMNFNKGSAIVLEVSGTATSFSATIQGIVDEANDDEWTVIGVVNSNSFDTSQAMTSKGIYMASIEGVYKIKVNISAISGGNLTIVGKMSE